MPYSEVVANNGKDYLRYNGTIVTVLAGFLLKISLDIGGHFEWHETLGQKNVALGVALFVCSVIIFTLKSDVREFWDEKRVLPKYQEYILLEEINAEIDFRENDKVLVYYQTNFGVPSNGSKYYLSPCLDYKNVFTEKEYQDCKKSGEYTCTINLVNATVTYDGETWKIGER